MSGRIERFRKRKAILQRNQSLPLVKGVVDQEAVDEHLNKGSDASKLVALDYTTETSVCLKVDSAEVKMLINDLKASFHKDRFDQLIDDTKRGVVLSIAGPFGIGKVISAYDKTGGNVTTVNNANNNVYAEEEDRYRREQYTHSKNSKGEQFANAGKKSAGAIFTRSQMDENNMVQDAYTGKTVKADTTSPDHIESLSQHHKNGGFMQTSEKKANFATDEHNLALTERSINQSMRDFDKDEWMSKRSESGIDNEARFGIDEKRLKGKIQQGKETSRKHLPTESDKAKYYFKKSAATGISEGAKMGVQQAFAYLLTEFFSSAMYEIKDAYNNGLEGSSLYTDVKTRLTRVGRNLASKWKEVVKEFSEGFLSGLISNLITTLVNVFVTTSKRFVRMIREGVFSLLKALKMILFPPDNMSFVETMHEAMKLVASGGIIIAGVSLEEYVEKHMLSTLILAPIATVASAVIVGALTAIAMSLVAYLIDKMDILGVIKEQENRYVLDNLQHDIDEGLERCEQISDDLKVLLTKNTRLFGWAD